MSVDSLIGTAAAGPSTVTGAATNAPAGTSKIDQVSSDFESLFLSQMLGEMFKGDEFTSFFGGGSTGEIYKGYMMDEFGKAMTKAGGIGIATQVKTELLKLQEITS